MLVCQDTEPHVPRFPTTAVRVRSVTSKFRPEIVMLTRDDGILFQKPTALTTGASKLKILMPVPTTPVTVSSVYGTVAVTWLAIATAVWRHETDVAVTHDVVPHVIPVSTPVGVGSALAKLRPVIVTLMVPDAMRLYADSGTPLTTGASNVNDFAPVPTTELTVTDAITGAVVVADKHLMAVDVVHDVVAHAAEPMCAEAV